MIVYLSPLRTGLSVPCSPNVRHNNMDGSTTPNCISASIVLQRNLPRNFPYNNIYCLFPLVTPEQVRESIEKVPQLKAIAERYDFGLPKAPKLAVLKTTTAISYVFNQPQLFATPYHEELKLLSGGYGYASS